MPIVLKSGSLNFLEPSGPVQACNGIASLLPLPYSLIYLHVGTLKLASPPPSYVQKFILCLIEPYPPFCVQIVKRLHFCSHSFEVWREDFATGKSTAFSVSPFNCTWSFWHLVQYSVNSTDVRVLLMVCELPGQQSLQC